MAKQDAIYKCSVCGNVVSVFEAHGGTLVCCDKEMILQESKTSEVEGKEKHVPIIGEGKVKVGSIPHPMEEEHYIELIQIFVDDKLVVERRYYPGDTPELKLPERYEDKTVIARAYCNMHGLWRS